MPSPAPRLHRRMIPTLIVLGVALGRHPIVGLLLAIIAWPALLVMTGVDLSPAEVLVAAAIAVPNVLVGIVLNRLVAVVARRVVV